MGPDLRSKREELYALRRKRRKSPKYRRKPSNRGHWKLTFPDGREEQIIDLKRWCKLNGHDYRRLWTYGNDGEVRCAKADVVTEL